MKVVDREDAALVVRGVLYGLMLLIALVWVAIALGAAVRLFLWAAFA